MEVTHEMVLAGYRVLNTTPWMVGQVSTPAMIANIFNAMLEASIVHDHLSCAIPLGRGPVCTCDAYDLSEADLHACMNRSLLRPQYRGHLPPPARNFAHEVLTAHKARLALKPAIPASSEHSKDYALVHIDMLKAWGKWDLVSQSLRDANPTKEE